jgi:glycosyltransferase involved in cell wall biosynthesis
MKISLVYESLATEDAIGACVIHQAQFFRQRGDDVCIYVSYLPRGAPPGIEDLIKIVTFRDLLEGRCEHFSLSDLYIYHYPGRYSLMESIRGIDRGTVIFNYHNVTPPELWGTHVGREWLMRGIEGLSLAHYADFCLADSPFNKQDLIARVGYHADRVHVLPLFVDLQRYTPGDKDPELVRRLKLQGHRVLLFVGRMAGNKRIDLLVEALAQIKDQAPDVKLLLVGDDQSNPAFGEIVSAVRSRSAELGIEHDVVWTGRVDDQVPYFRLADVYVTASLHEGFGLPLIEAMACDVPVVASRAGAMPWVLENAGLLCEPGNAEDLAEKALIVLQDAGLRLTLIERGRERAQTFSKERYEAGLARILDQVAAQTGPHTGLDLEAEAGGTEPDRAASKPEAILKALAQEIQAQGDVALRDYEVRSGVPLLGSLIVWIRRTLTSHLREPYLDPIVERQVSVNLRVAEWIARLTRSWTAASRRQAELEERLKALEAQVELLRQRLSRGPSPDR